MPLSEKIKALGAALCLMAPIVLLVVLTQDAPSPRSDHPRTAEPGRKKPVEHSDNSAHNEKTRKYLEEFEYPPNWKVPNLTWTASVEKAVAQSRRSGKRILLVIESVNSVNSWANRMQLSENQEIRKSLREYVLLALFIDELPEFVLDGPAPEEWREREVERNREVWFQTLQDTACPNYAIVEANEAGGSKVVEVSPFLFRLKDDPVSFIEFLKSNTGNAD